MMIPELRKNSGHELTRNVGQTEITTLKPTGEFLVIKAKQMQDRWVEVIHGNRVLRCHIAKIVRSTVGSARLDASPRHPDRKCVRMMITTRNLEAAWWPKLRDN